MGNDLPWSYWAGWSEGDVKNVVDYIFYKSEEFVPTRTFNFSIKKEPDPVLRLPSSECGSDHIPLASDFTWSSSAAFSSPTNETSI